VFIVPQERTWNNGSVNLANKWFHEDYQIPPTHKGQKFKFDSIFDLKSGGVGFDNIEVYTNQK
jgi:hypothetical protein